MRVGGQCHSLSALPPGNRPDTHRTKGWKGPRAGLDGHGKISPTPRFDRRTVQPIAVCYTDYDILVPLLMLLLSI
jgi:hypothetical protein